METAILINEQNQTIHIVEVLVSELQDGENMPMEFISVDPNTGEFSTEDILQQGNSNKSKVITTTTTTTSGGESSSNTTLENTQIIQEVIVHPPTIHDEEEEEDGTGDHNNDASSIVIEQEQSTTTNDHGESQTQKVVVIQKYCVNCSEPFESTSTNLVNIKRERFEEAEEEGQEQQQKDTQGIYEIEFSSEEPDPITSFLQKNNIETDSSLINDESEMETQKISGDESLGKGKEQQQHGSTRTVKVQNILSSIYKLDYLNSLLNLEENSDDVEQLQFDEDIPVCNRCAHSLASLYKCYNEFNQLRQMDSYLSKRISKFDQILENHINTATTSTTRINSTSSQSSRFNKNNNNKKQKNNITTSSTFINKPAGKKRGRKRKTSESEYRLNIQKKKIAEFQTKRRNYPNKKIPDSPLGPGPYVKLNRLEETPEIIAAAAAISGANPSNYGLRRHRNIKIDPDFMDPDSLSDSDEPISPEPMNDYEYDDDGAMSGEDYRPSDEEEEEENEIRARGGGGDDDDDEIVGDENIGDSESPSKKRRIVKKVGRSKKGRGGGGNREKTGKVVQKKKKKKKRQTMPFTEPATLDCVICNSLLGTAKDLTEHYLSHVDEQNALVCPVCTHLGNKSPDEPEWKGPGSINKPFMKKSTLLLHIRGHSGEKPLSCPVYGCQETFAKKLDLKRHVATHDVPPEVRLKPYNCPNCPRSFETAQILKIHIRRHTNERPYTCNVCEKSFVQSGNLKQHLKTHTGEKPHLCSHCGKAFAAASALERHVRIHTGELPYQCEVCFRAFRVHTALTRHQIIHTGLKKHLCPYCGKAFTLNETLKRHIQTHTGARPYSCTFPGCNFSFPDNRPLKRHMLTHGPFQPQQQTTAVSNTITVTTTTTTSTPGSQVVELFLMSPVSEEVVIL